MFELEPFGSRFPGLAERETHCITIYDRASNANDIPAATYAFVAFFCPDPKCDCRRVLLAVFDENRPSQSLASISFGFDRDADDAGPFLDPLNRQAPYAEDLLELAETYLFSDPQYVARLERHYNLFKEAVGMNREWLLRRQDRATVAKVIAEKKSARRQRQKQLRWLLFSKRK